jgi:uncharacterized protein YybS (DUF2232 family)
MDPGQGPTTLGEALAVALRQPRLHLGVGLTVGLFLLMVTLPLPGVFLGAFTPAPLIYNYCRHGRFFGLTMIAAAAFIVALIYILAGRPVGVLVFAEYAVLGLVIGEGLNQRVAPAKVVLSAAVAVLGLTLIIMTVNGLSRGMGPWSYMQEMIKRQFTGYQTMYQEAARQAGAPQVQEEAPAEPPHLEGQPTTPPGDEAAAAEDFEADLARVFQFMLRIFPGLSIMGLLMVAFANYLLASVLLAGAGFSRPIQALKAWQAPEWLVWPFFLGLLGLAVGGGWFRTVSMNVLLVLGLIYFLQGLVILSHFLRKKGAPLLLRALVYLILAVQPYLALGVVGLGLFDLWFDFRKLKQADMTPPDGS